MEECLLAEMLRQVLHGYHSIFQKENMDNIDAFLKRHSEFKLLQYRQYTPEEDGTDGFFFADLKRGS